EPARQAILEQFRIADVTRRGFLDKVQVQQNPTLRVLFPAAEGERNWKLPAKELAMYVDLLGQCMASCMVLTITDHGPSLFELINVYHDGRLRQRELQSAWQQVGPWDRNTDGCLTRDELPHQFGIVVSQGQPGEGFQLGDGAVVPGFAPERSLTVPARGPLW